MQNLVSVYFKGGIMDTDRWVDVVLLGLEVALEQGEITHDTYSEVVDKTLEVEKILKGSVSDV
jgi:hypothetical protein